MLFLPQFCADCTTR